MSLKKHLTTEIKLPFWFVILFCLLLGTNASFTLARAYDDWQIDKAMEQCTRQSPKPCKINGATVTVYVKKTK